jgi:hypothetical protein
MSPFHRGLVKWARTVHLYTTLAALGLVLFFAVTGFMLNHEDWFNSGDPHTETRTGLVPVALLRGPDKLAVVELLRKDYGASGTLDSFAEEGDSFRVVFKAPGRRVEAAIERDTGAAEVTSETRGFAGIILDLHRGKATGSVWSLVIDAVAGVLLLVSGSGLILWWSLRGRGRYGLLVVGLGVVLGVVVFFTFVP